MAQDSNQTKEVDLDRTDRLPVLEEVRSDADVADDAVRLEYTAVLPMLAANVSSAVQPDFTRVPLDLPSLAESMRSVEERIARQRADYEALSRLYERARDAEAAAVMRANALAAELSAAQAALAVEEHRSGELDRALAEKNASLEVTRERLEAAIRASEQTQAEARLTRDTLAARDATIAEVLRSLGERDAQLQALQREHAEIVPALEAHSKTSARLDAELKTERQRREATALELGNAQQSVIALNERLKHGEAELHAARQHLSAEKGQSAVYLEALRTREWRRGFDQTLFIEWDAGMDAARAGQGAAQAERDGLRHAIATLNSKLLEQVEATAELQRAAGTDAAVLLQKARELQDSQRARVELEARITALESEQKRSHSDISERDQVVAETEKRHAEARAQIAQLQAEAEAHEGELAVLMAHLNEARHPLQPIEADIKRLTDELALKTSSLAQLNEENRELRAALERTRGALEEREFLIRRLERSESNNANVLGRIQTSIERLGTAPVPTYAPLLVPEFSAEFIRVDGRHDLTYPISRRTRIGRAPDCDLRLDSTAVSRHHAVLLKGTRELLIEDLNSTNGVLVNGRKTSRQQLNDGDLVTIGDIQFRCALKFVSAESEPVL